MNKKNILIFPAGAENAMNIYDSLKYNLHFNLYGASSVKDYATHLYPKNNYKIGDYFINDVNFIENFNNLLNEFSIDYVIPTHDTITEYLIKEQDKIKAIIVSSPYETAKVANNKKLIFESLKGCDYIPKVYDNIDEIKNYPVFLKPYVGAGGKGTKLIENRSDLEKFIDKNPEMIINEYLPGEEITVDCFTNSKRELLFVGPRSRDRITMGISFSSKNVELTKEIKRIANALNDKFVFRGAWFFQLKKNLNDEYKLLEFSVRQAGTMALYRQIGINFAALSVFDFMGFDLKILFNHIDITLERRLTNSYKINFEYDEVFVDFDDTLIVNNKINTTLIKFLYQQKNKNKKINLITKHIFNLNETLEKFCISELLFDKIILLKETDKKSDFVKNKKSIFIDNYFKEREDVITNCKIPVFDVDAIESLIDYSDL